MLELDPEVEHCALRTASFARGMAPRLPRLGVVVACLLASLAVCFDARPRGGARLTARSGADGAWRRSRVVVGAEEPSGAGGTKKKKKKTKGSSSTVSPALRSKLLQEAQTPWRTVRTFLYGSFGLSATIGGLTALTQFAAAVTNQPDALPVAQTLTNIAVDFGVVGACLYGNSVDSGEAADITVVGEGDGKALADDVAVARLATLARLTVDVGSGDMKRSATVQTLQRDAGQAVVVLGGSRAAVDDALLDALIQRTAFARAECVVVPVRLDDDDAAAAPSTKALTVDEAPFVALPCDGDRDGWRAYLADEIATAADQGADTSGGVVVALRRDGTVASRNVGKPPWPQLIAAIDQKTTAAAAAKN